ncbi:MAG: xanthine dehydrogenase accessory protein XdhC [Woeseia sp.]|nr:xanthine dehydrogenase accessory protein XdhC [Woeseia sp.]
MTLMNDWLRELAELHACGQPAVLVTVAGTRGSAPREVGAKMLVTGSDTRGTIGGGALEYQCVRIATEQLQTPSLGAGLRRFPLGSNCGQCCGGVVDILFEPLAGISCITDLLAAWKNRQEAVLLTVMDAAVGPCKVLLTGDGVMHGTVQPDQPALDLAKTFLASDGVASRVDTPGRNETFLLLEPVRNNTFNIAVFGAGHVGSALVQVLAGLPCELRWIDERRDVFPTRPPNNVTCINSGDPVREVAALPADAYYFVMTHSHALDLELTAAILRRADFSYCGLIGSQTKRNRFEARLRKLGIADNQLQRLTCPIGLSGIRGKRPQEIAISAAAEVLRRREPQLSAKVSQPAQVYPLHRQQQ